jgi:signal peptidase II
VHGLQTKRRAGALAIYVPLLAAAAVVAGLDQLTKQVALARLADGPVDVVDSILTLRITLNPGGAFGVLQGVPGFFLVATLGIVLFILVWVRRLEDLRSVVPMGMILGGGLGNLFDRLVRDTGGRVVDFVDLHVWPVFNLADASISLGVVLILWFAFELGEGRE